MMSCCSSPLKQVPAIVDCLMMTLLRLSHPQRGDCILYWCFVEIFAGVADCDEGCRVQFVSNTTKVLGTVEWQLFSFADCFVCTTLHHLVWEVAEAWSRGCSTAFGVVFCVTTDEHPQPMAQWTEALLQPCCEGVCLWASVLESKKDLIWGTYGSPKVQGRDLGGQPVLWWACASKFNKPFDLATALRKSGTGSGDFYGPSSGEVEKFLASKRHVVWYDLHWYTMTGADALCMFNNSFCRFVLQAQ